MKIGKIKFSICTFQFAISNIITHHGGTGAMRQWTPRVKECVKLLKNENWKNKIFNLHWVHGELLALPL